MDEYIKKIYKARGDFGKSSTSSRRSAVMANRREKRNNLFEQNRKISVESPLITKQEKEDTPVKKSPKQNSRFERLLKWREEKLKKKQEEMKMKKPLFKVTHVDKKFNADIDESLYYIKGKKITKKPSLSDITPSVSASTSRFTNSVMKNKTGAIQKEPVKKNPPFSQNTPFQTNTVNKFHHVNKIKGTPHRQPFVGNGIERKKLLEQSEPVKKLLKSVEKAPLTDLESSKSQSSNSPKSKPKKHLLKSVEKASLNNPDEIESYEYPKTKTPKIQLRKSVEKAPIIDLSDIESPETQLSKSIRKTPRKLRAPKKFSPCSSGFYDSKKHSFSCGNLNDLEISNTRKVVKTPRNVHSIIIIDQTPETEKTKTPRKSKSAKSQKYTPAKGVRRSSRLKRKSDSGETEKTVTEETETGNESTRPKSRKSQVNIENSETPKEKKRMSMGKSSSSDSPCYKTPESSQKIDNDVFYSASKNVNADTLVYVSPFVTISRGKEMARKEYHQRRSMDGSKNSSFFTADATSPKAAAKYFTRILNDTICKIQEKCDLWLEYKEHNDLTEDSTGLIDMTIGQSKLLISKKFQQFRSLINQCENQEPSEMRIKCEDLHGFWDMISKQATNLDKRFEYLEEMKANDWLETVPKKKTPKEKLLKKKKRAKKPTAAASSLLKEAILAAKKKRTRSDESGKNLTPKFNEGDIQTEIITPGRGILKSENMKSDKRKTVAFRNVRQSLGDGKENSFTPKSLRKSTPSSLRKSGRLSSYRSKLVFD